MILGTEIEALRLGLEPPGWDWDLQAVIGAVRLGLGLDAKIQVSRLGFGP